MTPVDLEVFLDEWLLNPYQFVSLIPGTIVVPGQPVTPLMCQPMGDITGGTIGITISDPKSTSFTPLTFDTNGSAGNQIIIDDGPTAIWHYSISNSNWTQGLYNRGQADGLRYSLVLTLNGKPKRMWGGAFNLCAP